MMIVAYVARSYLACVPDSIVKYCSCNTQKMSFTSFSCWKSKAKQENVKVHIENTNCTEEKFIITHGLLCPL